MTFQVNYGKRKSCIAVFNEVKSNQNENHNSCIKEDIFVFFFFFFSFKTLPTVLYSLKSLEIILASGNQVLFQTSK